MYFTSVTRLDTSVFIFIAEKEELETFLSICDVFTCWLFVT